LRDQLNAATPFDSTAHTPERASPEDRQTRLVKLSVRPISMLRHGRRRLYPVTEIQRWVDENAADGYGPNSGAGILERHFGFTELRLADEAHGVRTA
jgi:hypothetical protein